MPFRRRPLLALLALIGWLAAGMVWGAEAVRLTIELDGLSDEVAESVLAQLALERERDHPLLDEYRLQRLHRQAPDEIREALQPFGFYSPTITPTLTQNDAGAWTARYVIEPGEPVVVSEVLLSVEGAGAADPTFVQWRERYPLGRGDVLLHETYEQARQALQRSARDKGYLDGHFLRKEIRVNAAQHSAVIDIAFATGARYRYGEVRMAQTLLDEALLHRYLTIYSGEYYDADQLLEMQRHLADSDYFQRADVVPVVEEARDGVVPIAVRLEMRKRTRYSVGAGYATDTGPRATLGVERRYVNSRGDRFGAELTASETRTTLTGRYRIPLDKPATDSFTLTGGWEEETLDNSYRETISGGAAQTRQLHYWQQTVGLTYQTERFTIADTEGRTSLLMPGVRWQRIETDNRILPNKGWRAALGVKGANDQLLSDTSFMQVDLRGKLIVPLLGGRIITRADLGGSNVAEFQELPLSQRFFAGGDFSVRGYAYNSLGPTNASGEVVGGKHLLVGSVEYDHYFGKHFGLATFLDAGNAFDVGDFDIYQGAGAGMRWRFPFGVLRVDGARALSDPAHRWRLHISIGPEL